MEQIKLVSIDDIKPYEKNPRDNELAVEATSNSIAQFDWQQPIVLDKNNEIVAGHTRYLSAKKLGEKEVPVIYAKHRDGSWLTDDEVKAYRLADNKTSELASWNTKLLADELDDIKLDMTDFGFDEDIEFRPDDDFTVALDEPTTEQDDNKSSDRIRVVCPNCKEAFYIDPQNSSCN